MIKSQFKPNYTFRFKVSPDGSVVTITRMCCATDATDVAIVSFVSDEKIIDPVEGADVPGSKIVAVKEDSSND